MLEVKTILKNFHSCLKDIFLTSLWQISLNITVFTAGPIPLRVREADIPIVSDTECIRKVNAVTEKIFILPASSFCAGGEEGNDACQVSITFLNYLEKSTK